MVRIRQSLSRQAQFALLAVLLGLATAEALPFGSRRLHGAKIRSGHRLAQGSISSITGRLFYFRGGVKYYPAHVNVTCWDSDITASLFTFSAHDQLCTAQTDDDGQFRCTYAHTVDAAWYIENPDLFCDFSKPGEIFDYRTWVVCDDCKASSTSYGDLQVFPDRSADCAIKNGCGPVEQWGGLMGELVPETYFHEACDNHDCCYGLCGETQEQCDSEFSMLGASICRSTPFVSPATALSILEVARENPMTSLPGISSVVGAIVTVCEFLPQWYYKAVSSMGSEAYSNTQLANQCAVKRDTQRLYLQWCDVRQGNMCFWYVPSNNPQQIYVSVCVPTQPGAGVVRLEREGVNATINSNYTVQWAWEESKSERTYLTWAEYEGVDYLAKLYCDSETHAPNCTFASGADVAIMLDASGSICDQKSTCAAWNEMRSAGVAAIDALSGLDTLFYVATFADFPTDVTDGLQPAEQARTAVTSAPYTTGATGTGGALTKATRVLNTGTHTTKIVLLVTDGRAGDPESARVAAQQLKDNGTTVVTLGVVPDDPLDTLDEPWLQSLASTDSVGQALYARASSFGTLVPTLQALLGQQLCSEDCSAVATAQEYCIYCGATTGYRFTCLASGTPCTGYWLNNGTRNSAFIKACDAAASPSGNLSTSTSCYSDLTGPDGTIYNLALTSGSPPTEQVTECGGDAGSTCTPWPVRFENQAGFTLWVAVHGQADDGDGLEDGYCINGLRGPGELCTRAWLEFAPGEIASVLDVGNRYFYYYASGTNSLGSTSQTGEGEQGTVWLELQDSSPTGTPCVPGSSASCHALKKIDMGETCLGGFNVTLHLT